MCIESKNMITICWRIRKWCVQLCEKVHFSQFLLIFTRESLGENGGNCGKILRKQLGKVRAFSQNCAVFNMTTITQYYYYSACVKIFHQTFWFSAALKKLARPPAHQPKHASLFWFLAACQLQCCFESLTPACGFLWFFFAKLDNLTFEGHSELWDYVFFKPTVCPRVTGMPMMIYPPRKKTN